MKFLKIFILLFICTSCQPKPEIIHDQVASPTDSHVPTESQTATHGTVAGGGGVGINNRPLESYKLEWSSHKNLETIVMTVIQNVSRTSQKLAADLLHIKKHRVWYDVPVEIDSLPADRMGVYFQIDQEGIQNYDEVWLSDLSFGKQSVEDQAALVLHELSLGVYILKNSNSLDHCLAQAAASLLVAKPTISYLDMRKDCFAQFQADQIGIHIDQKRIDLSDQDYKSIRYLSTMLIETKGLLESKNIEEELKTKGYQLY